MTASLFVALGATFVAVVLASWALFVAGSRPVARAATGDVEHLPLPWRIGWPILARLAPPIARVLDAAQRERLREALARAGLDTGLEPEHFVAGQIALALGLAAMAEVALSIVASASVSTALVAVAIGVVLPRVSLRERIAHRRHAILRHLPHDLDVVTLSVEAGLNLGAALAHAVMHGPPGPLREEWHRVLRDVHAGQARHDALRAMSTRIALPAVSNVVAALIAAERQGASLAPILRAQAEQRRTERFLRAERLAMEAPVKMLLPLVLFIFPGTFAILLFPIVQRLLVEGVL